MAGWKQMRWRLMAVAALLVGASCGQPSVNAEVPPSPIKRGINILGADPLWMHPDNARFKQKHFKIIRTAGFDFVRVAIGAMRYMDNDGKIPQTLLQQLDWVVANAQAAGLSVIIDEHDNRFCGENAAICRTKLRAFWRQIGDRYQKQPRTVLFEILNEPHGQMVDIWNDTVAEMLSIIRSKNPDRWVIVGSHHSNSPDYVDQLNLPPNDRNIIVSFHYYRPDTFTHQGAPWNYVGKNLSNVPWGSPSDRAVMNADFAHVAQWAGAQRRPVLLGEFGVYDGSKTPIKWRVAYNGGAAREAEKLGFSWSYWQFDGDFVAYDMARDRWVPSVLSTLIPKK